MIKLEILCNLFFISSFLLAPSNANALDMSTFFEQKTIVEINHKRKNLFQKLLTGKKVLHVGCTDYPIFNPETNLHLELAKFVELLDGCDIDEEGIALLKSFFNGRYFTNIQDATERYNYVLVPEVIEHVGNVEEFLKNLNTVDTEFYIITAPNAFFPERQPEYKFTVLDDIFYEEVHPDHNCWYSPFTLNNCIKKYTTWEVITTHLLENNSMVAVVCRKT